VAGLTGGEIIDLLAHMRGGIDEQRPGDLIERFDFDPKKKRFSPTGSAVRPPSRDRETSCLGRNRPVS
jgi:hypothetical protein